VIAGVADTHAALWYLLNNPRLSATARSFMDDAARAGHGIALSPISLAEIVYLVEKGRLPASAYDELREALNDPDFVLEEASFTGEVVEAMRRVTREDIPDMPDRIVAATAIYFAVPVTVLKGPVPPGDYARFCPNDSPVGPPGRTVRTFSQPPFGALPISQIPSHNDYAFSFRECATDRSAPPCYSEIPHVARLTSSTRGVCLLRAEHRSE
jgi:PIN domain nuclease of toxin-antitoxin system